MTPTAYLRVVERDDGNGNDVRIVQQWWSDREGIDANRPSADRGAWRDVPFVGREYLASNEAPE